MIVLYNVQCSVLIIRSFVENCLAKFIKIDVNSIYYWKFNFVDRLNYGWTKKIITLYRKTEKTDKTTVSRIVSKKNLLLNNRHTTTILQMVISVFLDWFILNFSIYPLKEKKEIAKPFITWLQNKDVAKSYICNCCSKIEWYIPFQMVYVVDLKKGVKVRLEVGK